MYLLLLDENMMKYLKQTPLLDFDHKSIQQLIANHHWYELDDKQKIQQIYLFVRDDINFGYNSADDLKASVILKDGIGQCNTKSILLMALLRAVGIECRLHGFTIEKSLQKGAFTGLWYTLAPKNILHTWVEVNFNNQWFNLEGVILDKHYLSSLQKKYKTSPENFCGYGVYTEDLLKPLINWDENHTYIQKLGINQDFGLFDDPDSFYQLHQQIKSKVKQFIFKKFVRQSNNKNVEKIRNSFK
jgi:hypothetical protein